MIYRILTDFKDWHYDETTGFWDIPVRRFGGAMHALGDVMSDLDLPAPHRLTNERTRFYFTERGWQLYGRHIYAEGRKRGHVMKLIRRKNPHRSQIVYEDDVQMAILPDTRCREHMG